MINNANNIKLNRKFGYTIVAFLLLVAGYHLIIRHKQDRVIVVIALTLLVFTLIKPIWLNPLRVYWDKLVHVLGVINTHVLLTLFYALILTPLGLMMRLLGKDILKLKKLNDESTYWEIAPKNEDSKMENQF